MKKKEILEIRKQLTPENCCITRIATCYVNSDMEKNYGIPGKIQKKYNFFINVLNFSY